MIRGSFDHLNKKKLCVFKNRFILVLVPHSKDAVATRCPSETKKKKKSFKSMVALVATCVMQIMPARIYRDSKSRV